MLYIKINILKKYIFKMILEILAFVVIILSFYIWRRQNFKDRYPPGPFGFPIVGVLPFLGSSPHKTIEKYGEKYGKVFSLQLGAFNVIVLNDYNLIKTCLKQEIFSGRPNDKMLMMSLVPNGIVYNEGPELYEMRRFTMKNLRDFGWGKQGMNEMFLEEVEGLINHFKNQTGKPIELKSTLDIAILNSVARVIAGKKYTLDDEQMIKMNMIGHEAFIKPAVAGTCYFLPWLAKIFPKWSHLDTVYMGIDFYTAYLKDTYAEHIATYDPNCLRDLTDCFLKEEHDAKEKGYFSGEKGYQNYIALLMNLFVGGADTSSTSISWSIAYLLHYPDIMRKIKEEIDTVIGRSRLPTGNDRPNMPYTEACMWEIMRMSAIVPGAVLHSTLEDVEVEGYKLPKRTIIMPNLHHVHHDKEYWGDPEAFRPERFLAPDGAFIKNERVIPFGIGKRVCIAESLAQTTVFMFLTGFLQNFDISVPEGHPMPSLTESQYGLVLSTIPYKIQFELRD